MNVLSVIYVSYNQDVTLYFLDFDERVEFRNEWSYL
jgi:hypothetical protein